MKRAWLNTSPRERLLMDSKSTQLKRTLHSVQARHCVSEPWAQANAATGLKYIHSKYLFNLASTELLARPSPGSQGQHMQEAVVKVHPSIRQDDIAPSVGTFIQLSRCQRHRQHLIATQTPAWNPRSLRTPSGQRRQSKPRGRVDREPPTHPR